MMLALLGAGLATSRAASVDLANAAAKMGWKLGTQAYTFKNGTYVEAVAKAKELGLKYMEIFPGQTFSKEQPFKVDITMTPEQRETVKKTAADAGITLVSFGVTGAKEMDAKAWDELFAFGKAMGLEFIDCEPKDENQAPEIAKIADKYGLRVAVHNHPQPAHYWSPKIVMSLIKKANGSKTIGSVTDTGHFVRSGLDPLASVRALKGHTFFFHFKDLNAKLNQVGGDKSKLHDVPWGTGINEVYTLMNILKNWGWKGCLMAEYEYWTPEQMDNLRQSYEYLNMVAAALDKEGWEPVFKDDLSNAQMKPGAWTMTKGVLESKGKGDIFTKEQYGDFILDLEFKCAPKTNSGVFLRMTDPKDWLNTGMEIQIMQKAEKDARHNTGALYDVQGVKGNPVMAVGKWNHMTIIARKNMIYVVVNGFQVNCINLDQWTEKGKNPDGTNNKFKKTAYKDMARKGMLSLQYHGSPISFRNVQIKTLD